MRGALLGLLVPCVLVGCLQSTSVQCDGYICPADTHCDPIHQGCALDEQLVCAEMPQFSPCSYPGVDAGRCYDGVCLPAGCGNRVLDPDEACDDGNRTGDDGCSADCTSPETCGSGVVDFSMREVCDDGDGDLVHHDGCSNCLVEVPRWFTGGPPAREGHAMVFDANRNATVLFGGHTNMRSFNDTWEWQLTGWRELITANAPRARSDFGMTYDAHRKVTVLFGGTSFGVLQNDTWEWDGARWTQIATPTAPPPRTALALAYDAERRQVVLYGGDLGGTNVAANDTWVYDGSTWREIDLPLASRPDRRAEHALAYDPVWKNVVLFGGRVDGVTAAATTWTWNGTAWTRQMPSVSPPPRRSPSLAASPARGVVLMSGGGSVSATQRQWNDMWQWDGEDWAPLTPFTVARRNHAMAFDGRQMIVFGGARDVVDFLDDTEVFTPSGLWGRVLVDAPPRYAHSMAYDASRGESVLFGGFDIDDATSGETYVRDGYGWRLASGSGPPSRAWAAMAYDRDRKVTVLFGGSNASGAPLDDTWEWDGRAWHEIPISGLRPPGRETHALAYDAVRKKMVLFGGGLSGVGRDDTWTYDGTAWVKEEPAHHPSARTGHAMAFDRKRDVVTLVGGREGGGFVGDTWTWDGSDWTLSPAVIPPRAGLALCYHSLTKQVIAFGGTGASVEDDLTWTLAGTTWVPIIVNSSKPIVRTDTPCAFDEAHGTLVITGGLEPCCGALVDTWELRYDLPTTTASDERCMIDADADLDGKRSCLDPDCAPYCAACGDQACVPGLESVHNCPADCADVPICGDLVCAAGETTACPGDCL